MSDQEQMSETRKPGRPKSQSLPEAKKGRPAWKPASVTDVTDKEAGYRYRWSNKSPDNLAKKEAEGWETVSKVTSDKVQEVDDRKIHSGKNLSSVHEKHDVVLQRMPEEVAQSRDEYMNNKTQKRTMGLTAHLRKEVGGAQLHGKITIGSLSGGEQVID